MHRTTSYSLLRVLESIDSMRSTSTGAKWMLRTLSVPEAVAKIRGVLNPDDSGNISGGVS